MANNEPTLIGGDFNRIVSSAGHRADEELKRWLPTSGGTAHRDIANEHETGEPCVIVDLCGGALITDSRMLPRLPTLVSKDPEQAKPTRIMQSRHE